ncbi:MAG TPA: alpha-amylase family protein [Planctomycetota bacterium]|nr:alpha-amylase family protein [Planctomycetota bacterium]
MKCLRAMRVMSAGCMLGLCSLASAQTEPPVDRPVKFERILWCSDPGKGAALAKEQGYTAIQLGRGGDAAAVAALGLGYYLDQPIGKGCLELRDEQWTPLQKAYEKQRDRAALVRPGCFASPGLLEQLAAQAAEEVRRVRGPGLRFVALADEASSTRHNAPLDTCQCEHCIVAFRAFVRERYKTLDAVNQVLGAQYASFEDVVPVTTDQVRRRELGETLLPADLRAFAVRLDFVDEQFAHAITTIAASAQRAAPGVPVGLTGLQVPGAFGGNDYARFLDRLTLAEPYAVGASVELARSLLRPSAHRYATLVAPAANSKASEVPLGSMVGAQLAAMATSGLAGVVVWNDGAVASPDGKPTPFGAAVTQALSRWQPVLDACAGATVEPGPVWVLESQASVRVWWMLDSAADGLTWVRRLASYESEHSTSQKARLGWTRLLQDLGLQPHFVAEGQLPERLLQQRPRCLVLPACIALHDRTAQAISAYVAHGGTVLADHSVGLYDGALQRRSAGALDEVFGITARSLAWDDLLVRQGRSTAREQGLPLAERGLQGKLAERRSAGDTFLEMTNRGRGVYLNAPVAMYDSWRLDEQQVGPAVELRRRVRSALQQAGVEPPCEVRGEGLPTCIERVSLRLVDGRSVLALRLHALDSPKLLQSLAAKGPRAMQVDFPVVRTLRHLGGDDLGTAARFDVRLDPFGALFLEVLR